MKELLTDCLQVVELRVKALEECWPGVQIGIALVEAQDLANRIKAALKEEKELV